MAETEGTIRRRTVLIGAGAVVTAATVGAVAACGTSATPRGRLNPEKRSPAPAAAAPITKTTGVPVGGGTIFADQKVVVTQPTAGAFHAFSAICTHMGCTVGTVANGLIMCPCHGSEYSITDGSVKRGPALSPLSTKQVTITGDEISVTA
jgi:Rieske Fe-S protein